MGIDNRLSFEPWNVGESRGKNYRVWFSQYLIVHFEFTNEASVSVLKIKPNPANWFQ